MTDDNVRPALGELARRATAVIEQNAAKNALPYGSQERNDANRVLLQLIVDFREAASPEVVLQLVALASGGADVRTAFLAGYFDGNARGVWEPDLSADDVSDAATHAADQYGATATITEAK